MKKTRNLKLHDAVSALREAVINHAYGANMDTSVIEGIRHASDLWLLARRHQSVDDIMREVKVRKSDPDIARISNDLRHAPEELPEKKISPRDRTAVPQTNWVMV
jgi:hypothetical protein